MPSSQQLHSYWRTELQVSKLTGYREIDGDIGQLQKFGPNFCKVGEISDVIRCFRQKNLTVTPSFKMTI